MLHDNFGSFLQTLFFFNFGQNGQLELDQSWSILVPYRNMNLLDQIWSICSSSI